MIPRQLSPTGMQKLLAIVNQQLMIELNIIYCQTGSDLSR